MKLVSHKVTGRADYLGKVVNRETRVAGARLVAVVEDITLLELGNGFDATFLGMKALKGVHEEMVLYAC
jgi:hypothetical protein